MSALTNLKKRLEYAGGTEQRKRMDLDKLNSLKKALLYSYQAQTAILKDNREFRCLINHDKLKEDYDDKIISIPYKDICLNATEGVDPIQDIGMKVGDVFTWKETATQWIVIQEILEENAYFRATIRKAEDEIIIDGKSYYGYLGKWSKDALWHTKGHNSWSEMGYEVVLYITRDETTEDFFHRYKKVEINGRLWEVQMVNDITSETMLIIYLKEAFTNEFEPVLNLDGDENNSEEEQQIEEPVVDIIGPSEVYPFDEVEYQTKNIIGGTWSLSNSKARIKEQTDTNITITIVSAKSGTVDLIYKRDNGDEIVKTITIKSL